MNECMWVLIAFVIVVLLVLYINYLITLHGRVRRLEHRASPRLEIIEREVHGIGYYMRIIIGIAIFFCVCVCVHYLCFCHPHIVSDGCPKPDALGTTITIFGVVITLLVGWQIFSNIKERERIEHLVEHNNDLTKKFEDRFAKVEQCCENRKQELQNLINAANNSFDRIMAVTETYTSDIYKDLMTNFSEFDIEYRYISHRLQALQSASKVGDIIGCNIIVSDMIPILQRMHDFTLEPRWKNELVKDVAEVENINIINGYDTLSTLINNIPTSTAQPEQRRGKYKNGKKW